MKVFISYLIAALLIGVVLFSIFYWLVKMDLRLSIIIAFSGVLSDVVVESVNKRRKRKLNDIA